MSSDTAPFAFSTDSDGHRVSPVLASAEHIARTSNDVRVSLTGVTELAEKLHLLRKSSSAFNLSLWKQEELTPSVENDDTLMWITVVDTLNFCFWAPKGEEKYACLYKGKTWTGYWALCAAVNRAIDDGIPLLDAKYLSTITEADLKTIFRSESTGQVPLLRQRLQCLRELGLVLCDKFGGHARGLVESANGSAIALVETVMSNFQSYADFCDYRGRKVYILKRAQILVADIWACFEGKSCGSFHDIDRITMFADYRVPQSLVALNVIQYTDSLTERLWQDPHLAPASTEETEIRGCSIWGVEMLRRQMALLAEADENTTFEAGNVLNAITLDFYLWTYAKQEGRKLDHIPFHKTWTHFY